MHANEYQRCAAQTAIYGESIATGLAFLPDTDLHKLLKLNYVALKLNGEAGELAELIGKAMRDDNCILTIDRKEAILKELGDVLWYGAQIATELEAELAVVMEVNIDKLAKRKIEGKIHGVGSDR